jgi:hypothetical protein
MLGQCNLFVGSAVHDKVTSLSGAGLIVGLFFILMYVRLTQFHWVEYTLVALVCGYYFLNKKIQSISLWISISIMILSLHVLSGYFSYLNNQNDIATLLKHDVPFVLIAGLSLMVSYLFAGKNNPNPKESPSVLVHVFTWLAITINVVLHGPGSEYKTFLLGIGAVALFFYARSLKKSPLHWLYQTDTFIAQLIGLLTILSLLKWNVSLSTVFVLMFIETMVYLLIMMKEGEEKLYRLGTGLMNLLAIMIIGYFAFLYFDSDKLSVQNIILLVIALVAATSYHMFTIIYRNANFDLMDFVSKPDSVGKGISSFSFLGSLIGFFFIIIYVQLFRYDWIEYGAVLFMAAYLFIRQKIQSPTLLFSLVIMIVGVHVLNWYNLYEQWNNGYVYVILHGAPLLVIPILSLQWDYVASFNKKIKWFGIYLFSIHLFVLAYLILQPISPILFGVVALVGSLIYFEIANVLGQKYKDKLIDIGQPDRYLLHFAYFGILAFLLRHVFVHLQLEDYWSIIKIRFVIELVAMGVFIYASTLKKSSESIHYKSWNLHPWLIELTLLFFIFTISLEISAFWQSIVWVGTAFALSFIGIKMVSFSRLKLYAFGFYLATAFQVGFLTSSYVTPSTHWTDQAWLSGLFAIALLFAFLVIQFKYINLSLLEVPSSFRKLTLLASAIDKRKEVYNLYPLIFCVAIFFYWSFDKGVLTLLWVVECLSVFIVSLIIRKQQFRYVALAALALCIIRLIFFDLAQASTLAKALVFLGVGVIMLVINFLYRKYKDRFEDEAI